MLSITKVSDGYLHSYIEITCLLPLVSLILLICYTFISSCFISLLKVEKAKADLEDDISQGSEGKSDSNGQSSTPGLESDHDYTIIGSSSPTHTEDRWVKLSFY